MPLTVLAGLPTAPIQSIAPSPLRLPVSEVLGVLGVLLQAAAPISVAAAAAAIAICRLTRSSL